MLYLHVPILEIIVIQLNINDIIIYNTTSINRSSGYLDNLLSGVISCPLRLVLSSLRESSPRLLLVSAVIPKTDRKCKSNVPRLISRKRVSVPRIIRALSISDSKSPVHGAMLYGERVVGKAHCWPRTPFSGDRLATPLSQSLWKLRSA